MITPIELDRLSIVGEGARRPETVVVTHDDRILVSDGSDAAVSEILPDGRLRPIGHLPGECSGMSVVDDSTIVIAVFDAGQVCTLDLSTEQVTVLVDEVDGQPLTWPNFPLADPDGTIWLSRTTASGSPFAAIDHITADGSIARIDKDGTATTVAAGIPFANCLAFDADRDHLLVVRSTLSDVARYEIEPGGRLRPAGRFGPPLGDREPHEVGEGFAARSFDPEIGRRWALADGCGFDAEGNLWVTLMTANKIVAIDPGGQVHVVLDDPAGELMATPTSIAWGGPDLRDLYIGSLTKPYVLRARSPIPGQPLWYQRRP